MLDTIEYIATRLVQARLVRARTSRVAVYPIVSTKSTVSGLGPFCTPAASPTYL